MAVNVGVVGVGNCASSLVQGLAYYSRDAATSVGLTNPVCAGYAVSDVRITSAFDVEAAKIGRDLSEAIWTAPNNALRFADVPHLAVTVRDGILADGVGHHAAGKIHARGNARLDDVVDELRRTATDVVVSFLPVGSQRASEVYAEAAVQAGCGFVNCMPATIARSDAWGRRFEKAGLPLLGDDLKSQFGATLVHHALMDVLARNGVQLRGTSQIVSGGNMDFLNMQDPDRVATKKTSKVRGFGGARAAPRARALQRGVRARARGPQDRAHSPRRRGVRGHAARAGAPPVRGGLPEPPATSWTPSAT